MANDQYGFGGSTPDKPRSMGDMSDMADKDRQQRNDKANGPQHRQQARAAASQGSPKAQADLATAGATRELVARAAINTTRLKQLPKVVRDQQLALLSTDPTMHELVQKQLDEHDQLMEEQAERQQQADEAANKPISEDAARAYGASQGHAIVAPPDVAIAPHLIDYNRDGKPDRHANSVNQGMADNSRRRSGVSTNALGIDRNRDGRADYGPHGSGANIPSDPGGDRQDSIGYRARLNDRKAAEEQFDKELSEGSVGGDDERTEFLDRDAHGNLDLGANDPNAVVAQQQARLTQTGQGDSLPPVSEGTKEDQSSPGADPRIASDQEDPQVRPAVAGELASGEGQVSPAPSPAVAQDLAAKPMPAPVPPKNKQNNAPSKDKS